MANNELRHGSFEPVEDSNGDWYCALHRVMDITEDRPCFYCRMRVDKLEISRQIQLTEEREFNQSESKKLRLRMESLKSKREKAAKRKQFLIDTGRTKFCEVCQFHVIIGGETLAKGGSEGYNMMIHKQSQKHKRNLKERSKNETN